VKNPLRGSTLEIDDALVSQQELVVSYFVIDGDQPYGCGDWSLADAVVVASVP
jgi:hypothetical protein